MKEIEIKSIKELKRGDIVRSKNRYNGESYIIEGIYENYVIGVRTKHISNPNEWIKIVAI